MPRVSGSSHKRSFAAKVRRRLSPRSQAEHDLEEINQLIYTRNLELAQTNKTLALLQSIDSLVLSGQESIRPLSAALTQMIVKATDFPFVAILGHASHDKGQLEVYGLATAVAVSIADQELINRFRLSTDSRWLDGGQAVRCLVLSEKTDIGLARLCHCKAEEVRALRQLINVGSICIVELTARNKLVGVMLVGFEESNHTPNEFEQTLFTRLSGAVGIAIDHKLLLDENQRVLHELTTTNAKLRQLDQAKDEFISMASHQLRSPLTSVKGYLSMVLEGDAGKLNDMQLKLIEEAFAASQRMVYLIGDFLNVSRLKTGKFVLERRPIDLARLVSEEVEQMRSTAASRQLTLKYQAPSEFPLVDLDINKIRQVIMNFIDNAIFYSHEGTTIAIELMMTNGEAVLRVKDTGIGVPKREQHQLFTKFYRASNARKIRPDGTGIGLFMAKKVIVAHGGALVFESQEGKGSTFGFRLPLRAAKQKTPG